MSGPFRPPSVVMLVSRSPTLVLIPSALVVVPPSVASLLSKAPIRVRNRALAVARVAVRVATRVKCPLRLSVRFIMFRRVRSRLSSPSLSVPTRRPSVLSLASMPARSVMIPLETLRKCFVVLLSTCVKSLRAVINRRLTNETRRKSYYVRLVKVNNNVLINVYNGLASVSPIPIIGVGCERIMPCIAGGKLLLLRSLVCRSGILKLLPVLPCTDTELIPGNMATIRTWCSTIFIVVRADR